MTSVNTNMQQESLRSRESTPEQQVIPSQHKLQQILEMSEPFLHVPLHIIADYQARGLIFVSEEGEICLASPMKRQKKN